MHGANMKITGSKLLINVDYCLSTDKTLCHSAHKRRLLIRRYVTDSLRFYQHLCENPKSHKSMSTLRKLPQIAKFAVLSNSAFFFIQTLLHLETSQHRAPCTEQLPFQTLTLSHPSVTHITSEKYILWRNYSICPPALY